jgi:hypothetical protein
MSACGCAHSGPAAAAPSSPPARLPAGGHLSLRATARDAGASAVDQTLVRAVAIR